jgi:flavin reductase (DIM6/NTAB) family NADH-FMN oxidoreductase RutF/uncharacterized protein YciI
MVMVSRKVQLDPEKCTWRASLLPEQIVVVSTVNQYGDVNLAPKSGIITTETGPMLAFGCHVEHTTYQNITTTGAFVVNIPGEPLAARIWLLIRFQGAERLWQSGFRFLPAQCIRPPLIAECRAHLECQLDSVKQFADEAIIFGKIVAASIDAAFQDGNILDDYLALRPIFLLADNTYGAIDTTRRIDQTYPAEHQFYVVEVGDLPEPGRSNVLRRDRVTFLHDLQAAGKLLMAGTFADGSDSHPANAHPTETTCVEMYVISAASQEQAKAVAHQDPLVQAGAPCTIRSWRRGF